MHKRTRARVFGSDDAGRPGFIFTTSPAVDPPKGTPKEIGDRLKKNFIAAATSGKVNTKPLQKEEGHEPDAPRAAQFIWSRLEVPRKVVKAANIMI